MIKCFDEMDALKEKARVLGCSSYEIVKCVGCKVDIIYCTDEGKHFWPKEKCTCVYCGVGLCNVCHRDGGFLKPICDKCFRVVMDEVDAWD